MARTIVINLTDAQYTSLVDWELEHRAMHEADGVIYVYTAEDLQVILWIVEPDGKVTQQRLEYDGWYDYRNDEESEEWVQVDEDEDEDE